MRSLKLLTVVGARPQFIKAAVVCRAIAAHNARVSDRDAWVPHPSGWGTDARAEAPFEPRDRVHPPTNSVTIDEVLVHTGQHYDANLSQVFFDELQIPAPTYNLGVGSAPHGRQTADMLVGIERVLLIERPDIVLVYGDTNSTLAGAMAAAKLCIPIAHVEAGLRSFNRRMPEEINRILTDSISEWLFCPTKTSVDNLAREGRVGPEQGVHLVGDVMYDSVLFHLARVEATSDVLARLGLSPRGYYLATMHRAENTDDPARLDAILAALASLDAPVLWPLHPRTRAALEKRGHSTFPEKSRMSPFFMEPLPYSEMLVLQKNARAVLTDSGGVQKEAYLLAVPCITLRDETEWTELVDIGANRLVGCDASRIRDAVWQTANWRAYHGEGRLFGNGRAGEHIVSSLVQPR